MSMQFVANRENGSFVAKQDNVTVGGIAPMGDAFTVTPAEGIAFDPESFATLEAAKHYVAESVGETLPKREKIENLPTTRTPKRERKIAATPAAPKRGSSKRASTSAAAAPAKVSAPKVKSAPKNPAEGLDAETLAVKMRNVGFANRVHRFEGKFDVYVDDPALLKAILKRFRNIPVHVYAKGSVAPAGTANIYPTPAQADKIAAAFPNTDVAAQCTARGWKEWRIATRSAA